ncbi:MAG: NAD(P)H-hydrate dehydratase [Candidatus Thorarchaeota archaeon]
MVPEVVSTDRMRTLELNTEWLGISLAMLMQNAGREVARVIEQREQLNGKRVVVLCGLGGNGGDGFVTARYLHEAGASIRVFLLGSSKNISSPESAANWRILQNLHEIYKQQLSTESEVLECADIRQADIIVDAMLGFTLKNPVREPMLTAIKIVNESSGRKYAIDVPSGIDADTGTVYGDAVRADVTITLHAAKPGLITARQYTGEIVVVPIGIPHEASTVCGPGDLWLFNRPRRADSKKGDSGRVLVVGGSNVYSGAPALAGMAALRTGADLVTVLAPRPVVGAIRAYSPNLMVREIGTDVMTRESVKEIITLSESNDVVAMGPGLGNDKETYLAVRECIQELVNRNKRMVIDADALKALGGSGIRLDPTRCVLTPHWGEIQILLQAKLNGPAGLEDRKRASLEAARQFNSVILLKGPTDVIAHPDGSLRLNRTGVPAMTVGGTGDVLTGITATLLTRGRGALEAACAAAFVSGKCGEAASEVRGDHIVATDCIEMIPRVMTGRPT